MLHGLMNSRQARQAVTLRPYQREFDEAVTAAFREYSKVLAVLPTGGGKTTCAGAVIAKQIEHSDKRVLVVAHTRKLVNQFRGAMEKDWGLWAEVEMANEQADPNCPIVVSTVQSMSNRIDKRIFHPEEFGMVVVDECHRVLGGQHRKTANAFSSAKVLGLTATPRRSDQKDLMSFFDFKAIDVPLSRLIGEGWLAPLTIKNIPIEITLESTKRADWSEEEVAHAIEPYLESCADAMIREGNLLGEGVRRCCLSFLPLVKTSRKFVDILRSKGVRAAHVGGDVPEEEVNAILSQLTEGSLDVVCNSMLLTEGVDIRPVDLILNLRPTKSWTLYVQICGRGTRLFGERELKELPRCERELKQDCLLLDPLWQCEQHSLLQRPSSMLARNDAEADRIDKQIAKAGGGKKNLMEAFEDSIHEHETNLKKQLELAAKRKARQVDAMEFFTLTGLPGMTDYEPIARWEMEQITSGQRDMLTRNGFDPDSIKSKGHASAIIDTIIKRQQSGFATPKQCKYARSLGMDDAYLRPRAQVEAFIAFARENPDAAAEMPA